MYDILIRGGQYPDFHMHRMVYGDIAIKDGIIVALGDVSSEEDSEPSIIIDASGKVVSPGFIDLHMHEERFDEVSDYQIAERMLQMGVTTCLGGNCGSEYQPLPRFREILRINGGSPVNYLMLAGYNTLREAMGINRYENASDAEISNLAVQVGERLKEGAAGLSFGLEYAPGISFDEAVAVIQAQNIPELYVAAHYRSDAREALSAIDEMIRIAEESGAVFQISHLSSCSAMGQMDEALNMLRNAMEKNPRIDYDTYPYNAFSTYIGTTVFDDGCFERWDKSYDSLMVCTGKYKNQFCTKEIFEELRREHPEIGITAFVMNEEEIAQAIANPYGGIIGSDGAVDQALVHPRSAGTFPRVLGKYVREEKVISMIDALRKMTLRPAERLGLQNKGQIKVGCDADITVFNPDIVADGATFENPLEPPLGIDAVLIGGKLAVKNGEIVNARAGVFIEGPYTGRR